MFFFLFWPFVHLLDQCDLLGAMNVGLIELRVLLYDDKTETIGMVIDKKKLRGRIKNYNII